MECSKNITSKLSYQFSLGVLAGYARANKKEGSSASAVAIVPQVFWLSFPLSITAFSIRFRFNGWTTQQQRLTNFRRKQE